MEQSYRRLLREEKAEIRQREKEQREREEKEREREREREEKKERRERKEKKKKENEKENEKKKKENEKKKKENEKKRKRTRKRTRRKRKRTGRKKTEKRSRGTRETSSTSFAKINAEIEISRANKSTTKNASHEFVSKVPKMAPFSESKGDTMDAFIFRFEMLVKSYDWSEDTKFLALSNLLTGDSLRVLQTLSLEQQNYKYLNKPY